MRGVPHPSLKVGRHGRLTTGPCEGLKGILIQKKNELRFVVSIKLIQGSILVDVEACSVEPISSRHAMY
jgi:hypothetical protein